MPLRYSAPGDCPDVERYLDDVRARSSQLALEPAEGDGSTSAEPAAPLEGAVAVHIDAAPDADGWVGRVTIDGPRALEREVRGQRCEDVVAALALITVLRLEGSDASELGGESAVAGNAGSGGEGAAAALTEPAEADTEPPPPADAEASRSTSPVDPGDPASSTPAEPDVAAALEPPAASEGAEATDEPDEPDESDGLAEPAPAPDALAPDQALARADSERTASAPRPVEAEPLPAPDDGEDPAEASAAIDVESEASETEPWRWPAMSGGVAALAGYATVPRHAFRAALDAELRIGSGRSSWLSALSFAYARGGDAVAPGELELTLLTLELSLCPPALIAASSFWVSACASARGGFVFLAFTSTLPEVEAWNERRPWLAAGPSLRVGVPLSEHWALRGAAELAVQLVRDTFAVRLGAADDPSASSLPLYRPEALSFEVGAGIGYTF